MTYTDTLSTAGSEATTELNMRRVMRGWMINPPPIHFDTLVTNTRLVAGMSAGVPNISKKYLMTFSLIICDS